MPVTTPAQPPRLRHTAQTSGNATLPLVNGCERSPGPHYQGCASVKKSPALFSAERPLEQSSGPSRSPGTKAFRASLVDLVSG